MASPTSTTATCRTWRVRFQAGPFASALNGDFVVEVPDGKSCDAIKVTIVCAGGACNGTAGNDVIVGTAGVDVIHGLGGNDYICGFGGDDSIFGDD